MRDDTPPKLFIHRCDHLRLKVRLDDGWYHVSQTDGTIESKCEAGTYREPATLPDNWGSLGDYLVREPEDG